MDSLKDAFTKIKLAFSKDDGRDDGSATTHKPDPLPTRYTVQPLDLILFEGNDPVGKFIKNVEKKDVVPSLRAPFSAVWTHAAIVVDKSLLGYDWMEENTLYIYESVFSGTVVGYKYSGFLPLDQPKSDKEKDYHLGPQIRKLLDVVGESDADAAICPLNGTERKRIAGKENIVREFHQEYVDCSYPLSIMPQLAAASDTLYSFINGLRNFFPKEQVDKKAVFCSELTALLYKRLGVDPFDDVAAATITPLEMEVQPCFDGKCYYMKKDKKMLFESDGKTIPIFYVENALPKTALNWMPIDDLATFQGTVPAAGTEIDGTPLYIARAAIGHSMHPGKCLADLKTALVCWDGVEVKMTVRHEILTSLNGTKWVETKDGVIPEGAIQAGIEEDGKPLYIARGVIEENHLFAKDKKTTCLGKAGEHLGGALFPYGGKEVPLKDKYEVLCVA